MPFVEPLLAHNEPLVRGAAVWALSRLVPADRMAALAATARVSETDATVREEWHEALTP